MKNVYTTLGLALGASANLLPRDQCCFSLNAAGGKSGVIGQLGDGQNRVGQSGGLANQQGTYCLSNGGLTDQSGRGCILTPPTTQFQCDVGASPTTGFSVNSNGDLTYNGNTQFFACATGDNGGYNIYTVTTGDQTGCVKITLNTGGQCAGAGSDNGGSFAPASSAPPASQRAASAPPASAPPASAPPSAPASQGTPCATDYVVNGQTVTFTAQPSSCMAMSTGGGSQPPASYGGGNQLPATNGGGNGGAQPPASQPPATQPPGAMETSTIYQTTYTATVYSCPPEVGDCPATNVGVGGGEPTAAIPAPSGPASQPAASKPASSGPAQSVPASQPAGSQPAGSALPPSGTPNGNGNGANGNACPTALTGAYQTPHAIIPINKDQPGTSYGTQYNAYLSSSNSTIFNFDIPSSYSGKQCSVIFLFPNKSDLETSDFTISGSGGIKFDLLSSPAPLSVSYSSYPAVTSTMGIVASISPGNSYVVATGACQAGTTMSILASGTGGMSLTVRSLVRTISLIILLTFITGNPSPIGVYITSC
ncbi:hypothetical protein E4T39_06954 [Aureobasidium subglaciale]|nr:hypothetical protein E4T39_06954 [Aureobasidium subglaciale]